MGKKFKLVINQRYIRSAEYQISRWVKNRLRLAKGSILIAKTSVKFETENHYFLYDLDQWVSALVKLTPAAKRKFEAGEAFEVTAEQARPAVFDPVLLEIAHLKMIERKLKRSQELLPVSWYKNLSTKLLHESVIETEDAGGSFSILEYNLAYDALDTFCREFMLNPCRDYDGIAILNEINKAGIAFGLNWAEDGLELDTTSEAKAKARARAQVSDQVSDQFSDQFSDQVRRVLDAAATGLAAAAAAARNPLVELDTNIFLKSTGHPRPVGYSLSVDSPLEIRGVEFILISIESFPT